MDINLDTGDVLYGYIGGVIVGLNCTLLKIK